jgi:lipopolysaccharide transport system ATP-binding protein
MAAVSALCSRGVLIDQGTLALSSTPAAVIESYLSGSRVTAGVPLSERPGRRGEGRLRFTRATVLDERLEVVDTVRSGQDIAIALDYEARDGASLQDVVVQVKFAGVLGQPLFACLSRASLNESMSLPPRGRLICRIPRLPLVPGMYNFTAWCTVAGMLEDLVPDTGTLSVVEGDFFGTGRLPSNQLGDFLVAHTWSVD